jgi:23S rRNA (cytosine1962-C5)-methyltransferase
VVDRDAVGLIDAGDGRRLERFGTRVVDRPHPAAIGRRADPGVWGGADLRWDRDRGWSGRADPAATWTVGVGSLTLELRPTESGGVGLFPEQLENVDWLERAIGRRSGPGDPAGSDGDSPRDAPAVGSSVLNLFAHTGLLTLVAARAGVAVTHVDAARGAVAWARRNAELSGLADRPIRWIVDDALEFARREGRRGRRYAGLLLDPPSYGHGGKGDWRLERDLPALLEACAGVAEANAFLLLTAHSTAVEDDWLVGALREAFPRLGRRLEAEPVELEAESGARLRLGTVIRAPG